MPDRQRVYYKTQAHRFIEFALIAATALVTAALSQLVFPELSASYGVVAGLALGVLTIPAAGTQVARRNGAPLMTSEERSRLYLAEFVPLGLRGPQAMRPAYLAPHRRGSQRRARRG